MKVGICLSGGGIRSAAHIGVLKALKENNIDIDVISGTSGGSIVASLFACGFSPYEIEKIFIDNCKKIWNFNNKAKFILGIPFNVLRGTFGLINTKKFEKLLDKIYIQAGASGISTVKIPLAIPSVDLNSAKLMMFVSDKKLFKFNSDDIWPNDRIMLSIAVLASCSMPVVFVPKFYEGKNLVDGALRMNIPVCPLRVFGADKVIAVNLNCSEYEKDAANNLYQVVSRTIDIMGNQISNNDKYRADISLDIDLCNVKVLDLSRVKECVDVGYNFAISNMNKIKDEIY